MTPAQKAAVGIAKDDLCQLLEWLAERPTRVIRHHWMGNHLTMAEKDGRYFKTRYYGRDLFELAHKFKQHTR